MSSLHEYENGGAEDEYQVDIMSVEYFVVRMRETMNYTCYIPSAFIISQAFPSPSCSMFLHTASDQKLETDSYNKANSYFKYCLCVDGEYI